MGRRPRIELLNAFYHVIQRGNNKSFIFRNIEDKIYFGNIVKNYKQDLNFEIHGFVIMNNHYHMIIRPINSSLQEIMHKINNKYSKYYNYRYNHCGHVFEKRYNGIWVQDEIYLMDLLRYIHQNPVKANLCKNVSGYKWSSDIYYRKNIKSDFIDTGFIMNLFSADRQNAIKNYSEFMETFNSADEEFLENTITIADPIKKLEQKKDCDNKNSAKKIERKKHSENAPSLDTILSEISPNQAVFDLIKSGTRKRSMKKYKKQYVKNAIKYKYKLNEIGENINISKTAVIHIQNDDSK